MLFLNYYEVFFFAELVLMFFSPLNFRIFFGLYITKLTKINFTNFSTNKVQKMSFLFKDCSSLKGLNISNFNTCKVTDISVIFENCLSLIKLNISNFITDNIKYMQNMHCNCQL